MKRLIALVVAALLSLPLIALAGPGFRHGPGRGFGRGFGGMNPVMVKKFLKDAGCSDQQIRRIETLKDETERKTLDVKHQVEDARLEMKQLMQAESPDREAIFKQIDKIGALRLQMKKAWVGLMLDVRKELTPAQWEKLQVMKSEFGMKHRKEMRQRMHKPMPAPQQ